MFSPVQHFYNSLDWGLPGSSVLGIYQAGILEWMPFPPPGDCPYLPDPGIEAMSLASPPLAGRFFTTVPPVWVQFTLSVLSNNLQSHRLQPASVPWPSPTPRACWNLCPSSWWGHPTIWSSVITFSSFPQSFPASGTFLTTSPFYQVTKVLEFQLQHQSFQWVFRTDFL